MTTATEDKRPTPDPAEVGAFSLTVFVEPIHFAHL